MDITVDQYVRFRERGYLIVREVLARAEVQELLEHIEVEFRDRPWVHFLHRELEIHERFLLHPRIVDSVAGLVGPDVLALQTMLFVKPPGSPGQGYHQDSFHIVTQPDTLLGAWVALDGAERKTAASGSRKAASTSPCIRMPTRRRATASTRIWPTSSPSRAPTTRTIHATGSAPSLRNTRVLR
jgi:hypothetical protein